jgi:hypothetical protein
LNSPLFDIAPGRGRNHCAGQFDRSARTIQGSDDLVLELVSVTAIVKMDPEDAAAAPSRVEIVEPHTLTVHQPPGVYLLDNRRVQMTCARSAGV